MPGRHAEPPTPFPPARGRYTPPQPQKLQLRDGRPRAHKILGWSIISLGLGLVVVNYGEEFGLRLMPGGHQEAYFLLGLLIAAAGTWWLGLFDRARD